MLPNQTYFFLKVRPLLGIFSSCLLLSSPIALPMPVLAHAGHGDEFQSGDSAAPADAINVDLETAKQIGLQVEPVTRQALSFGIKAMGQIEASPNGKVEVTNPVGGTVIKLLVEAGQMVEAGQPLAIITSRELAELRVTALENSAERQGAIQQAQANLRLAQQNYNRQQQIATRAIAQAQTELRVAQERYDRDQELTKQGGIPKRELMESEANLSKTRKELTEAESRLQVLASKAELERAQSSVQVAKSRSQLSSETYQTRLQQLGAAANPDGTITIKAPISGTISDRQVTLGESAEDAGKVLMTIVDNRTVLASANIYEKDLNSVKLGQRVRITSSGIPDRIFEGKITVIGSVVEKDSRVVPVKAELDNSAGLLKSGMFAEMEILTNRTPDLVLAISESAIIEANGQQLVFVQNGSSFQPVEVTLGRRAGNLVGIESGLFEGDRIVTQRANQLYAQSLRGGKSAATSAAQVSSPNNALPWWAIAIGGGAIGLTGFATGIWAKRRSVNISGNTLVMKSANSHSSLDISSPLAPLPQERGTRE